MNPELCITCNSIWTLSRWQKRLLPHTRLFSVKAGRIPCYVQHSIYINNFQFLRAFGRMDEPISRTTTSDCIPWSPCKWHTWELNNISLSVVDSTSKNWYPYNGPSLGIYSVQSMMLLSSSYWKLVMTHIPVLYKSTFQIPVSFLSYHVSGHKEELTWGSYVFLFVSTRNIVDSMFNSNSSNTKLLLWSTQCHSLYFMWIS